MAELPSFPGDISAEHHSNETSSGREGSDFDDAGDDGGGDDGEEEDDDEDGGDFCDESEQYSVADIERIVYHRMVMGESAKDVLAELGMWHCRNCTERNFGRDGDAHLVCASCGTVKGHLGIRTSIPAPVADKTGFFYDERMLLHEVRLRPRSSSPPWRNEHRSC
jgi:hypothetical protein